MAGNRFVTCCCYLRAKAQREVYNQLEPWLHAEPLIGCPVERDTTLSNPNWSTASWTHRVLSPLCLKSCLPTNQILWLIPALISFTCLRRLTGSISLYVAGAPSPRKLNETPMSLCLALNRLNNIYVPCRSMNLPLFLYWDMFPRAQGSTNKSKLSKSRKA